MGTNGVDRGIGLGGRTHPAGGGGVNVGATWQWRGLPGRSGVCRETADRTLGNQVRGSRSPRCRLDIPSPPPPRAPGEQVTPGRSEAVRWGQQSSCYQRGKLVVGDLEVRPAGGTCRL